MRIAPFGFERQRAAPRKSAQRRWSFTRLASLSLALLRSALRRSASRKLAPRRSAPSKLAPVRSALRRSKPCGTLLLVHILIWSAQLQAAFVWTRCPLLAIPTSSTVFRTFVDEKHGKIDSGPPFSREKEGYQCEVV